MTVLTLDQWWDATYQMATFHEESGLPFVWLPTPTAWDENLALHTTLYWQNAGLKFALKF